MSNTEGVSIDHDMIRIFVLGEFATGGRRMTRCRAVIGITLESQMESSIFVDDEVRSESWLVWISSNRI